MIIMVMMMMMMINYQEDSTLLAAGADCDFGGGYCTMFLFLFVDIPSSTL